MYSDCENDDYKTYTIIALVVFIVFMLISLCCIHCIKRKLRVIANGTEALLARRHLRPIRAGQRRMLSAGPMPTRPAQVQVVIGNQVTTARPVYHNEDRRSEGVMRKIAQQSVEHVRCPQVSQDFPVFPQIV